MNILQQLESQISAWPQITTHPHRFGGREFRFGDAEVGHVHTGGIVDIPFPRALHDALLDCGLAEHHHFVPDSGWITFRMRHEQDLPHALWLMRLSYLRYRLKSAPDPRDLLERESRELQLSREFASTFEPFLPRPRNSVADVAAPEKTL